MWFFVRVLRYRTGPVLRSTPLWLNVRDLLSTFYSLLTWSTCTALSVFACDPGRSLWQVTNAPSVKFVTLLTPSPAESGQPGITTPGTFRPWSFDSFDGLLLCWFAHRISCGRRLQGSKSRTRTVDLLRADRQAGLASTRRRPPLDAAAVRDRSLAEPVTYPLVECSRPESFLACSKRVTHLTCSEEQGGRRAQPHAR